MTLLLALVAGASLVMFLANAGSIPLMDRDEGRYAEIGREMIESRNWIIPSLFGVPYLEKPPLLYWLLSISYSIFGVNEFAARLPTALAASIGVFLTGLFARKLIDPRAGVFSAVVLATSGLYIVLARLVLTDMLFAVSIAGALMFFFAARNQLLGQSSGYAGFWLCLALAMLSKGPAGLLICWSIILIDLALSQDLRFLLRRALWFGFPIFLAVSVPWFWLVQTRFPRFLGFYVFQQHLARFAGAEHSEPFYFFVPFVLAGLLPWTPMAFAALPSWIAKWKERSIEGRAVRFLLVWCLVVFFVFSASGGKLIPYILPMFPALAVLIGGFFHGWVERGENSRSAAVTVLMSGILVVAMGMGGAIFVWTLNSSAYLLLLAAAAIGVALVIAMRWESSCSSRAFALAAISSASLYLSAAFAAPSLCEVFTEKSNLIAAKNSLQPDDEIAMTVVYMPSEAFYLRRIPYVVNPNRELDFGISLVGGSKRLVPDLATLRSRTEGRRVFCLTGVKPQYLEELKENFREVKVIGQNRAATLVLIR
ncbi:MAG TPA: glycosyltransferase family 39 protein [Candidatus Binataceae bacterium]